MSTKSKKTAKQDAPKLSHQKSVAHVVEAALEAAGGRGMTVAAIQAKTGLKQNKIEEHLAYMAGESGTETKTFQQPLKNPRVKSSRGVYKLIDEPGSFRGESWIDDARALFVGAKKRSAAKRRARAKK